MSLQIIKQGLLDTIQDQGRYGYQHLGINPGGAMDRFSSKLANALLGNVNAPVFEMHFPSCEILFEEETIICITGADFTPTINKKKIRIDQPVAINKKSKLRFEKKLSGARCYLSVMHELDLNKWMNSYSTNLVAAAGGYKGRSLKKGDTLNFKKNIDYKYLSEKKDFAFLPWKAGTTIHSKKAIRFIKGNEWDWLTDDAINNFTETNFKIKNNSNRMGYHLEGCSLKMKKEMQLISSAVTFGTIQLLPEGQLIILMADHQTTGGYPRIGHVINADLPMLAQSNPGDEITFSEVEIVIAENEFLHQQNALLKIQTASKFKMEKYVAM